MTKPFFGEDASISSYSEKFENDAKKRNEERNARLQQAQVVIHQRAETGKTERDPDTHDDSGCDAHVEVPSSIKFAAIDQKGANPPAPPEGPNSDPGLGVPSSVTVKSLVPPPMDPKSAPRQTTKKYPYEPDSDSDSDSEDEQDFDETTKKWYGRLDGETVENLLKRQVLLSQSTKRGSSKCAPEPPDPDQDSDSDHSDEESFDETDKKRYDLIFKTHQKGIKEVIKQECNRLESKMTEKLAVIGETMVDGVEIIEDCIQNSEGKIIEEIALLEEKMQNKSDKSNKLLVDGIISSNKDANERAKALKTAVVREVKTDMDTMEKNLRNFITDKMKELNCIEKQSGQLTEGEDDEKKQFISRTTHPSTVSLESNEVETINSIFSVTNRHPPETKSKYQFDDLKHLKLDATLSDEETTTRDGGNSKPDTSVAKSMQTGGKSKTAKSSTMKQLAQGKSNSQKPRRGRAALCGNTTIGNAGSIRSAGATKAQYKNGVRMTRTQLLQQHKANKEKANKENERAHRRW